MSDFKALSEDELRSQQEALDNKIASLIDTDFNADDLEGGDDNADNISINSQDLNALDLGEGDDDAIDKLLNDDADDEELKGLLGDDDDFVDISEFNMDDPNLLAKLEQDEKNSTSQKAPTTQSKSQSKASQPQSKEPQPQPKEPKRQNQAAKKESESPAAVATSAAAGESANNRSPTEPTDTKEAKPKTSTPAPSKEANNVKPSAKKQTGQESQQQSTAKPSAEVLKARKAEYEKLIEALKGNIQSFNDYIVLLLADKDKTSPSRALAERYLQIRTLRQKDLQRLEAGMKKNDPVPPYRYIPLELKKEQKNDHLTDDELEIEILHFANVKSSAKWFIRYSMDLGTTQTGKTKTIRGSECINFNHKGKCKIVANARSSKALASTLRRLRVKFEVFKAGLIWDEKAGDGDMKANSLMSETSTQSSVRIRDDNGNNLGDIEVRLQIRRPFAGKHVITHTINMVKLESVTPDQDIQLTSNSIDASTLAPAPQPAPKQRPSDQQQTSKPSPAVITPAKPQTPAPAAQAPAPAAAASNDTEFGPALLQKLGIPETITPIAITTCLDPTKIQSFDALTSEEQACQAMLAAIKAGQKQSLTAAECQEKLEDIQRTKQFLEILVSSEKLSFETYLSMLVDSIARDKQLIQALMKLHKHFEKIDPEESKRYRSDAAAVLRRVKVMEEELKNAENMDDEDDEDAE